MNDNDLHISKTLHHVGMQSTAPSFVRRKLACHTKIESTVRYLGIEVDDALEIAEQVDV